jgi:hypothetical protein
MAASKTAKSAATKKLDPRKSYQVKLSRPIAIDGHRLLPRDQHWINGAAIDEMSAEDRASITVVE